MDVAKVAMDYYKSSQSSLLIPNREFGSRKMFHIGLTRSTSAGSIKLDPASTAINNNSSTTNTTNNSNNNNINNSNNNNVNIPSKSSSLKSLFAASLGQNGRQKNHSVLKASSSSGDFYAGQSDNADDMFDEHPLEQPMSNKQWLHPSNALTKGHILYTVKFLGECKVEQPKGTDVVKSAITKMKFNKHIKRAEGQKPPKVELTISADAVKILDPKNKMILHQYPLHRISYCADDKSDKRMFTFIGKAADNNDHFCYVFDSEKCAEEITLTIGQAFELAYKRFIEASTQDTDIRKQFLALQQKVNTLQYENDALKKRLADLEKMKDRSDVDQYKMNNEISDMTSVKLSLRESSTDDDDSPIRIEPNNRGTVVGRRLENLMLSEDSPKTHTNGNHTPVFHSSFNNSNSSAPILSPPPPNSRPSRNSNNATNRINSLNSANNNNAGFGNQSNHTDVFGMAEFNPAPQSQQELMDIRDGFSRGLSFGTDDFNIDDLDPLNQRL